MKNLIMTLVLFPVFSFSQEVPNVVLLEKTNTICYSDSSRNFYECIDDLSNTKIFIKDNILYFNSKTGIEKHDVVAYHYDEKDGKKTIVSYVVDVLGKEYDLLIYQNKGAKTITLASNKKDGEFISYR